VSAPTIRTSRERLAALAGQVVETAEALGNHIRANGQGGDEDA
jgi:hypothetical protein